MKILKYSEMFNSKLIFPRYSIRTSGYLNTKNSVVLNTSKWNIKDKDQYDALHLKRIETKDYFCRVLFLFSLRKKG